MHKTTHVMKDGLQRNICPAPRSPLKKQDDKKEKSLSAPDCEVSKEGLVGREGKADHAVVRPEGNRIWKRERKKLEDAF